MKIPILLAAALAASAGFAQPTPQSAPAGGASAGADPNEVICRRVQESGSRLKTQRVCATRAQWEAQRRADRQNTERAQTNRIVPR